MTRLPGVQRELVRAAGRRPGARWLAPVAVAAALLLAVGLAVARGGDGAPAGEVLPAVPEATLERSAELTRAPRVLPSGRQDRPDFVTAEQLPVVAEEIERATPYPPGRRDAYDWDATARLEPGSMAGVHTRSDARMLIEYRAHCLWVRYWLDADAAGAAVPAAQAAQVLTDAARWPTQRSATGPDPWLAAIAADARSGRRGAVARHAGVNCG